MLGTTIASMFVQQPTHPPTQTTHKYVMFWVCYVEVLCVNGGLGARGLLIPNALPRSINPLAIRNQNGNRASKRTAGWIQSESSDKSGPEAVASRRPASRSRSRHFSQIRNHGTPASEGSRTVPAFWALETPRCHPQVVRPACPGRSAWMTDDLVFWIRTRPGGCLTRSVA